MKLIDYINGLDEVSLATYAKRCGTTSSYMTAHIKYARKEPRKALREALSRESEGRVSYTDVLEHFGLLRTAA